VEIEHIIPPRLFMVNKVDKAHQLKACAHIELQANELVTFKTKSGADYDVTRTSWGYYATPSLNARLKSNGLRGVLVKNSIGQFFIWLVEVGKEDDFFQYLNSEKHEIITWLDNDSSLANVARKLGNKK